MEKVQNAIIAFEKYNNIKLENYVSDEYSNEEGQVLFLDNYIGKDIFENNIKEWLEFFQEEDREVFLDLLSHYRYFTKEQYRNILKCIYNCILEKIAEEESNDTILFITFPSKQGTASGGDQLRATLEETLLGKFKKEHIISDTDKLSEDVLNPIKYIVFIDDIVGSGATLYGNVEKIYHKLHLEERPDIKLFIAAIYANKSKINKKIKELRKNYKIYIDDLFIHEDTDKCFDSNLIFNKGIRIAYKTIVERYESEIENNKLDDDNELCCILGFYNGQLLVSFYYNTPNNTLSTFWRPSKISVPLFIRNKYIRPSINDIRKTKKHHQKNGYLKRKLENVIENQ